MICKYSAKVTVPFFLLYFLAGIVVLSVSVRAENKPAKEEQAPAQISAPSNSWTNRCDDIKQGEVVTGQYCEMVQSISVAKKGEDASKAQRLVEMAIGYPPTDKEKAVAVIILPLGILVDREIDFEIDGKKLTDFTVKFCESGGCIASFELSEKQIAKASKGNVITIRTFAADNRPVAIELSLSGFATAYDKVKPKTESP